MREFNVISSYQPIKVSVAEEDGVKGIKVSGIAVGHADGKPNMNGLIYPIETIKQYAPSLKGFPMVIDHENTIKSTVGKVSNAYEQHGNLMYDSDINEEHPSGIAKMLERKDVSAVSIMAKSKDIRCTVCTEQLGECPHIPLHSYDGELCAGSVHHLKWTHLSFILDPADPHATAVASSQNDNVFDTLNEQMMATIMQQFSELECKKEQKIKQNVKLMSSEDNKVSKAEMDAVVNTLKKEKDAEIKQKEEAITLKAKELEEKTKALEAFETREKEKLISQICEVSGEKPERYADMTVEGLETVKQSVVSLQEKLKTKKEPEVEQASGNLGLEQPPADIPQYDDHEEGVKFFQHLFNLKSKDTELPPEAKTVIKFVSQSEGFRDGQTIRGDK